MEIALSSHAGPDDVVTPLSFDQDTHRYQLYPSVTPRNFSSDKALEKAFVEGVQGSKKRERKTALQEHRKSSDALSAKRHGGAKAAKSLVGDKFWDSAYKFTIERHPYEKAVSFAWYLAKRNGDFGQALKDVLQMRKYRNFDLYTIDGKLAVDFIIRYENLAIDVPEVEKAIGGLPILSRLPKVNAHQRKDHRPAKDVLSPEQKIIVQETCREEFELLGYER